jgi:hypothetical protein
MISCLLHLGLLLRLPKQKLCFSETSVHGVISEKIQLLIAFNVRISNLRLKRFRKRIVIHEIVTYILINRMNFMPENKFMNN